MCWIPRVCVLESDGRRRLPEENLRRFRNRLRGWREGTVATDEITRRGGSWNNKPQNARSAKRNRNTPANRNNNSGFRPASTLPITGAAASHGCDGCVWQHPRAVMMSAVSAPVLPGNRDGGGYSGSRFAFRKGSRTLIFAWRAGGPGRRSWPDAGNRDGYKPAFDAMLACPSISCTARRSPDACSRCEAKE